MISNGHSFFMFTIDLSISICVGLHMSFVTRIWILITQRKSTINTFQNSFSYSRLHPDLMSCIFSLSPLIQHSISPSKYWIMAILCDFYLSTVSLLSFNIEFHPTIRHSDYLLLSHLYWKLFLSKIVCKMHFFIAFSTIIMWTPSKKIKTIWR